MRLLPIIATLLSTVGLTSAQEAYTLKFKLYPEAGKGTLYKSNSKDSGTLKIFSAEVKDPLEIKSEGSETVVETSVIAVDREGKPTVYARHYQKENKRENGKTTVESVEGKTLYWEFPKTGKPRIGIVGENTIAAKETEKLYERLDRPGKFEALIRVLDPAKAIRVGDTWKLDAVKFANLSDELTIDEKTASGTAKFAKVETVGKSVFGTFEIELAFSVKKIGKQDAMEFFTPIPSTTKGTLRVAIDGSTTEYEVQLTMSAKGTSDAAFGAVKGRVEFDITGVETATRSAEEHATIKALPAKLTWLPAVGEWVTVAPKDAGFKVQMPGVPTEALSTNREIFNDTWMVELDNRQLTYYIGRAAINVPNLTLKSIADGILKKNEGAKVEELKIAGEDACRLTYTANKIEFFHCLLIKDKVLWQVLTGGVPGKSKKEDREKFLKSFEFVEQDKK